jgi:alcohol dehydrogenase
MGVVDSCAEILRADGILVSTFTETEGNPSVETVEAAVAAYKESGADYIIALGGGSPMDVAKAVGVVAKYGGSITKYEGGGKVPGDIIPLIAIPTTAGTGSEVTAFSVITDHSRNYKLTVFSYKLIPAYAILDAELLTTAPASVAAACGVDAMVHAIEAYISKAASPFSDAMAEKALELIGKNIRAYVADRSDIDAAEHMLVGSLFAGIAFSWARLGDVHAMSHPVSAYYNVAHGVANAILLPTVMEYNSLADRGKYLNIYNYISKTPEDTAHFVPDMLVQKIRHLNAQLMIPESLGAVGVTEEHLDAMADDAMKSGNIAVNPRKTEKKDILELYRKAL